MSAASPEYTISHPAGPLDSGLPRTQLETPDHSRRLSGGWKVVARKELADHLRSVRFLLLLVLLGLIGIAAVNSTAGTINDIVGSGPKSTSLFLYLFTGVPEGVVPGSGSNLPSLVTFIGMLGPLLGLAFGFDAVSGERSIRTLPRLVSQPIHRDDVIKGKFASGLTAIALVLGVVIAIVSGLGVLRVGLVPSLADATRVLTYFGLALLYIGLWLGLSILASVRFREASTSALTVIATWMVLTLFLGLATGAIANWVHPVNANPQNEPDRYASQTIQNARFDNSLQKVSPRVSTTMPRRSFSTRSPEPPSPSSTRPRPIRRYRPRSDSPTASSWRLPRSPSSLESRWPCSSPRSSCSYDRRSEPDPDRGRDRWGRT